MKTNVSISSLDVYLDLKESGELSSRRLEVIDVLSTWANISCHHICMLINKKYKHTYPSSVAGRLNELVKMGLVERSADPSKCGITGNTVHKYSLITPGQSKAA